MKLVAGLAMTAILVVPSAVEAACRAVPLEFSGGNPLTQVRVTLR